MYVYPTSRACNMSPLGRRRGPALRASIRRRLPAVSDHARTYSAEVIRVIGRIPFSGLRPTADPLGVRCHTALKSEYFALVFYTFSASSPILRHLNFIFCAIFGQVASKLPPRSHLGLILAPKRLQEAPKTPPRGLQEASKSPPGSHLGLILAPKKLPRRP